MNHQRGYRLANTGGKLQLLRAGGPTPQPGPRQVLVRIGAASLNYRDPLILQDAGSTREGLVPLSDGAGTVVAVGAEVSRWKEGDRVSPGFFPEWHGGPFSAAGLAAALGGGQTDGVLSDLIVTSSSDAKLERARALGAWQTINYRTEPDWDKAALELTDGKGVDHILELGGPDTYERSISAIAFGGRIAQIGVLTGFTAQPNVLPLQFKNASINGICVGSIEHFDRLNRFVEKHGIRPVIDQVFAFDEAPAAYRHLKAAEHMGKVVIDLA